MSKLRFYCLSLLFIFSISVANAKVCFLPGVLADDGCLNSEELVVSCDGFDQTEPCSEGQIQYSCYEKGKTYYKCTCKASNITKGIGGMYECLGDYDPICGCPVEKTICNRNMYPLKSCSAYDNAAASEACTNPNDGSFSYKSCSCPEEYAFTCSETGLKVNISAEMCKSTSGEKLYTFCDCADNWTTEPCSENTSGCSSMLDNVYRGNFGGADYCYRCGPDTCSDTSMKNLVSFFCNVPASMNVDCTSLGYIVDESGKGLCPDGTPGLKCTFDSSYIFCEDTTGGNSGINTPSGCALGDVFYADGSCSSVNEYDANKIAVGVVFALSAEKGGIPYSTAEAEADGFTAPHGRVINLRNLTSNSTTYAFDPENPYDNSYAYVYFGLYNTDVSGLTNYSNTKLLTGFQNGDVELYSGKENTAKFASATPAYSNCTNGSYTEGTATYNSYCAPTAAKAALSFYPPEVSKTDAIAGASNWYLPAIGELALLYGIDVSKMTSGDGTSGATGTTKTIVNNTLTALANKGVDAKNLTNIYYWSSVEYSSSYYSVVLNFNNGFRSNDYRYNIKRFRVSLHF